MSVNRRHILITVVMAALLLSPSLSRAQDASRNYVKMVTWDADRVCVTVFTDLSGKKILERTFAGDTYYVYDDLGLLRFVTPAFEKNSRSRTMLAYEYRYDNRGRVLKKTLPGDGSEGVVCQTGYTAPYTISNQELEAVNYNDNYIQYFIMRVLILIIIGGGD